MSAGQTERATRCDECMLSGEHEVWCALSTESLPASEAEREWLVTMSNGRRVTLSYHHDATEAFVRANVAERVRKTWSIFDAYVVDVAVQGK